MLFEKVEKVKVDCVAHMPPPCYTSLLDVDAAAFLTIVLLMLLNVPNHSKYAHFSHVTKCFPLSQGFCRYLEESFGNLKERGVVIGYDARAHPLSGGSSKRFASLAAAVFISRGVPVYLFSDITPTPFVVITSASVIF